MAKEVKSVQVGGTKKLVMDVVKTIFVVFMFLFYMMPFILVIINSLKRKVNIVKNPLMLIDDKGVQFVNYVKAFTEMDFGAAFFNSILITGVSVFLILLCSSMTAYLFVRTNWLACRIFFALIVAYMVVPFQVIMIPLVSIYGNIFGILNSRATLIFMNLGFGTGMAIFMCHGFIKTNVPMALEEAAKIDGAGEFKILKDVVLPMAVPMIVTIGLMIGISYWNDWINGLYYITDSKLYSVQQILNRMLQDARFLTTNTSGVENLASGYVPNNGLKMAIAAVGAIPIMVLLPSFQKYYVKGLTLGSVKG